MRKTAAIIITITAIFILMTSCGNTPAGSDTVTTGTNVTDVTQDITDSEETEEIIYDMSPYIPIKDYEEYEFMIFGLDSASETWVVKDIYSEEQNGDPINDAVYDRNRRVEERYNISIAQTLNANPASTVRNSVMAGDDVYDLIQTTISGTLGLATTGTIYELSNIPYIEIEDPWWDYNTIKSTELAGKIYILLGDINIVDDEATWCLFFNKKIIEDLSMPDVYKVVKDGDWTLSKMQEYCRDVYNDLNGNGERDQDDQWGLLASGNAAATLLWSFGITLSKNDGEGNPSLTLQEPNVINALNSVYDVFADKTVVFQIEKLSHPEGIWVGARAMFREGRAFLYIGTVVSAAQYRDMDIDFGILPMPKYDLNQEEYVSTFQSWSGTSYSVPVTASDVTRTGIIMEAMASASVNTLTPAYYDTALQRKYTRDNESSEMLDLIFRTRQFDIVYAFDWGGMRDALGKALTSTTNTIVSDLVSVETKIQTAMDNAYKTFSEAE